jgi:multidrug efflux pump subunit AcrA (membrane-fusion protein)
VISVIHVAPNEPVTKGQPILELDPTDWQNRMRVTILALEVAKAVYRLAAQKAVFDNKSKTRVAVLKGRMDAQVAKVKRVRDQLLLLQVHAVRDGIAIYANPSDWIGRPVVAGEKIMQIAEPSKVELEIMLPIADAINLKPGAEAEFFLNIDPQNPLAAEVLSSSFRATQTAEGFLAYRLRAAFTDRETPPRIGLRGTAKVFGDETTVFFYLFRRPLAKARQWLGL